MEKDFHRKASDGPSENSSLLPSLSRPPEARGAPLALSSRLGLNETKAGRFSAATLWAVGHPHDKSKS